MEGPESIAQAILALRDATKLQTGAVQSAANTGTVPGTMNWIQMGDVKLLWFNGSTAYFVVPAAAYGGTVIWPTGLFVSAPRVITGLYALTGSGGQGSYEVVASTSAQANVNGRNNSGVNAGANIELFAIGV